jgi:hypothetical protein
MQNRRISRFICTIRRVHIVALTGFGGALHKRCNPVEVFQARTKIKPVTYISSDSTVTGDKSFR